MNVQRFAARTSHEAMARVRHAFGDDAVVLNTRPCAEGVEIVAMASNDLSTLARQGDAPRRDFVAPSPAPAPASKPRVVAAASKVEAKTEVKGDIDLLSMTTLSFQDYVRQRMRQRRDQTVESPAATAPVQSRVEPGVDFDLPVPVLPSAAAPAPPFDTSGRSFDASGRTDEAGRTQEAGQTQGAGRTEGGEVPSVVATARVSTAALAEVAPPAMPAPGPVIDHEPVLRELRDLKQMVEARFGAMAFMESLRDPRRTQLTQKLFDAGFSAGLARALATRLPDAVSDETSWAELELERHLATAPQGASLEDAKGVFALVGATGCGKTSCIVKVAAAFVARHGASQLGLVTLDAQRAGGLENLRAYGRAMGVTVHVAHDRASLLELLQLLATKRLVLIDTPGVSPRDGAAAEVLGMVGESAIRRVLVVAAPSQGETIEDAVQAFGGQDLQGVVLAKVDEAARIGPALDVLIRNRLRLWGTAHGQRLAEDWQRADARRLLQRALRVNTPATWRADGAQVAMLFAATVPAGA
jgi:flagellar biosynthesis protein FlhF